MPFLEAKVLKLYNQSIGAIVTETCHYKGKYVRKSENYKAPQAHTAAGLIMQRLMSEPKRIFSTTSMETSLSFEETLMARLKTFTSANHYNNIIEYNFLNLPSMVGDVTYTYLSDGTRLSARKANGAGVITRGSFSYAIDASGAIRLESVGHSEGRIYVGNSGELKDCWNIADHLGNVRSVINPDGMIGSLWLEQSDYLPFGMRINELSDQLGDAQRWHLAGKEYQKFGSSNLGLVDFGARYYLPMYCRWTSVDPMAEKYLNYSPYAFCGNNPVNFVDPFGESWLVFYYEDTIFFMWIEENQTFEVFGNVSHDIYESLILFMPGEKEFSPTDYQNIGSSTAVVFDSDGSISTYDACTYPSDIEKYPTIPEGEYEAMKGEHKKSYPALRMFDKGKSLANNTIELGYANPASDKGNTYASGINIHKAGKDNATKSRYSTNAISAGCFLIDITKWDSFMSHFNKLPDNTRIGIIVRR